MNPLIDISEKTYANNLKGLAYIKNSDGYCANLRFFTNVIINTKDNSTKISYDVTAFREDQKDYYYKKFFNYIDAVKEYNRLAQKFDPVNSNVKARL